MPKSDNFHQKKILCGMKGLKKKIKMTIFLLFFFGYINVAGPIKHIIKTVLPNANFSFKFSCLKVK